MKQNQVTLAFPCYNPTEALWASWDSYIAEFTRALPTHFAVQFVIVDDGSPQWIEPPQGLIEKYKAKLHRLPQNKGKGGALASAVKAMPNTADIFAFTDFDTPFSVEDLTGVIATVASGIEVCIADRELNTRLASYGKSGEKNVRQSVRLSRHFAHRVFRFFVRAIVAGGIADSQCGLKAYRADCAREIVAVAQLEGFLFDLEWLYIALRHKLAVACWPVTVVNAHVSSSLRSFLNRKLLGELLVLVSRVFARKYDNPKLLDLMNNIRKKRVTSDARA